MLRNADKLLLAMKQEIDSILANDEEIQQFLTWVEQKSRSVEAPYKPAAIRAFYFDPYARDFYYFPDDDYQRELDYTLYHALEYALYLDESLRIYHAQDIGGVNLDLDENLDRALARVIDLELEKKLQQLKERLPSAENWENFRQWWKINGQVWTEQLRTVMIQHRNIGHDYLFTKDQEELLQQYYDANCLLVACLNSDCYVSREVREEIEATLLLPYNRSDIST
jgi:hypothetical protein